MNIKFILFAIIILLSCNESRPVKYEKICNIGISEIMSNTYSRNQYDCFIHGARYYNRGDESYFAEIKDLLKFTRLTRFDGQLNLNLQEIVTEDSICGVEKNDYFMIDGVLDYYQKRELKESKNEIDSSFNSEINKLGDCKWKDYLKLKLEYHMKRVNISNFINNVINSGLLDSDEKCFIIDDLYLCLTTSIDGLFDGTDEVEILFKIGHLLDSYCEDICLLTRQEWYSVISDPKVLNDDTCLESGYFHKMYSICCKIQFYTDDKTFRYDEVKALREELEQLWSQDQYDYSYMGVYVYGYIAKSIIYELFYTENYEELNEFVYNLKSNDYLSIYSVDFCYHYMVEVYKLYSKRFNNSKDDFDFFFYMNFKCV